MAMSEPLYWSLHWMRRAFREAGLAPRDYALFGSASLVVRGIIDREPGDIDILVTKSAWGILLNRPNFEWDTPEAGSPPILVTPPPYPAIPLSLFFDWRDRWVTIYVQNEIAEAEEVIWRGMPIRCVPAKNVARHKRAAIEYPFNSKRGRHIDDILAIERYGDVD